MIRDGISTDVKRIGRAPKEIPEVYETDYLESVIRAHDLFFSTGSVVGARYLRDPYAIALFLEFFGRPVAPPTDSTPVDGELTCKEYYEAVINDEMDKIVDKMTVRERLLCNLAANDELGELKSKKEEIILEICRGNGIDIKSTMRCWVLQPDVEAISFALASKRAVLEGVTPVIGIPLRMIYPSYKTSNIRFPAVVEKNMFDGGLVHIHKDGELFEVWDEEGRARALAPDTATKLKNISSSYVVEGFINFGQFVIWDILCWNDVWVYRRPLTERVKMLWRFHEWNPERFVVRNWKELQGFEDNYILRNANSPYDPILNDSHIFLTEETQTAVLVVGGAKGKKTPCLTTHDKKPLFELQVKIDREDYGDIVEVSKKGSVVQILQKGTAVDTYSEVMRKWNLPDFEEYSIYRMPLGSWPEREK